MDWWHYPVLILYALCMLVIFAYTLMQTHLLIIYRKKESKPEYSESPISHHPVVTVQLPVYNEKYVISRLIRSVAELDWPKDKLEIQVLDDSTDESTEIASNLIESLRKQRLNIKHIRRQNRKGFKAGALAHGLHIAKGEFIVVFDADFVPPSSFLNKTIPLFDQADTGMVQVRWDHLNENASMLTRMQAYALNAHFRIEQSSRNAAGYAMNFNGTAGVWRKSCIVDAGGWHDDTLTEDLDLSYRAQLKGWKFRYLDDVTAAAELPMAVQALKTQQYRWTKGAAETSKKHLWRLWKSDWSIKAKLHGTSHLLSSSIYLFILLLAVLSVPLLSVKTQRPDLSAWFWSFTSFSVGIIAWFTFYTTANRSPGDSIWNSIKQFPLFLSYSMGLSLHNSVAVIKGWFGISSEFIRTPKFNTESPHKWSLNSYLQAEFNWIPVAEALLSIYFLSGLYLAVKTADFGIVPFHLMLAFGFGSISIQSFTEYFELNRKQNYAPA